MRCPGCDRSDTIEITPGIPQGHVGVREWRGTCTDCGNEWQFEDALA